MSQVVSRNLNHSGDLQRDKPLIPWRQVALIGFHGAVASTYGMAICWQNVSQASRQIYLRSNPLVRVYGRWRFLTYNCLVIQFAAYSLCLASHFVPRLRRTRDYFFTTFAFPIGMLVVTSFWSIWMYYGRENIFPASLEPFYPPWLNHVTHTIIAPINLVELLFVKKEYDTDRRSLIPLAAYTMSYTSFLLYIRVQTGRFVYPFLNKMDSVSVGAFITGMLVFVLVSYKSGKILHDLCHGVGSIKDKVVGRESKKKD